jgi:uncharacterized YigZ family protein
LVAIFYRFLEMILKNDFLEMIDAPFTYKTLREPSAEILFKEKNSKFIACAYPVTCEADVRKILEQLRKQHHGAGHFCYAWQIGERQPNYRANDDGEPKNTAGMPIYGQIKSLGLTNILVVVVRYFGGVKLGVGGLISAYRTAANLVLEQSEIVEEDIVARYRITYDAKDSSKVMRMIRESQMRILLESYETRSSVEVLVPLKNLHKLVKAAGDFYGIACQEL